MLYEYALISVLIASGYWGYYFVRHPPNDTPLFGAMQLATAVLCGLGLLGGRYDHAALGAAGAIGLGAGLCMLVLGPLVRAAARRLAASERIGIATRLLDVAEILAPGSGVTEEKALLGAMKEIREGRVEPTVHALTAAKRRAPAEACIVIDERIAMLYLAAYRWSDAIAHAEAHLMPPAVPPTTLERTIEGSEVSLRDALGIAPPVWVELLGAYGRVGELDKAARMMARLEHVCAGREDGSLWLHRARLMFLALAGRPAAVRTLVEPKRAGHMSVAARTYWMAVAHAHHGDRDAAGAAYEKARARSRGRPRELIDQALAELPDAAPVQLSSEATEVVAFIEASPLPIPARTSRGGGRGPWATWGLTGSLLAVAAVIHFTIGPSNDMGVMVRDGAIVRGLVDAGEWWRLVTCVFIHVGSVHLAVNAIGLVFLGRIAEDLFGSVKTLAIFGIAGLAGAAGSYGFSPGNVSAGASGAIFGVLGAVFIELTLYRLRYRAAWKRGMWGGLVVVTLAQAGIGLLYPVIDQWAHGAGLLGGVIAGAVLSPNAPWARFATHLGRLLALAFVGVAVVAAIMVTRTSLSDSLSRGPWVRHDMGNVAVTAPVTWSNTPALADPDGIVVATIVRHPRSHPTMQDATWVAHAEASVRDRGFDAIEIPPDRRITLPAGWEGRELVATFEDGMDYVQRYRVVAARQVVGDTVIFLLLVTPDTVARAVPELLERVIGSIVPA